MKLSQEAMNLFEQLAINAHHQVVIDELIANQHPELKKIYLSKNSECVKKHFSSTEYFADSVKVTEK